MPQKHKICVYLYPQSFDNARMAKLVDALVSGASAERLAGSSPVPGTKRISYEDILFFYLQENLYKGISENKKSGA